MFWKEWGVESFEYWMNSPKTYVSDGGDSIETDKIQISFS